MLGRDPSKVTIACHGQRSREVVAARVGMSSPESIVRRMTAQRGSRVQKQDLQSDAPHASTILFVRHTEVHNPAEVLYGRLPRFDLSETGRAHADRVAAFLAAWPVLLVVSSPLLRARRVARIIACRHPGVSVRTSGLLNEVGSAWHGTPFRDFPPAFNTYDNRRHPDDESMEQI